MCELLDILEDDWNWTFFIEVVFISSSGKRVEGGEVYNDFK